ncbi:MAG: hypothetical protein ABGY96_21495 [bacterium]|nr:hypothetical protein [Gammaproteobacteria bacterium]HIL98338.1 hypothetical protein [Pseudomonadales bacterium]
MPVIKPPGAASDDFAISRVTTQFHIDGRLRLCLTFVVYTRGGSLVVEDAEFSDLFHDALTNPIIDFFVIKLRYRFGN